jgi:UDP-glucose 4-epimerase
VKIPVRKNNEMKSKILVTGGAGYIGAHTVVELQNAGFETVIVDNLSRSDDTQLKGIEKITSQKPNFHQGDCLDYNLLRHVFKTQGPISGVIHFAAYKAVGESVEKPLDYYRNNIGSLVAVLEVMKEFDVKDIIFSSSCTVYGQPDQIPVSETAPFKRAESPYGATKQMCERILEDAYLTGYRIISLRYFNPIGAHPSGNMGELPIGVPSNLVPYITQTAIGKREKLIVFGSDYNTPDGYNIRDFIHVVDVASAHVKAFEFLQNQPKSIIYEVFNLGTGEGVSVMQLIEKFQQVSGVKLNYQVGARRPGDIEKVYADPTKIMKDLNWKARYSIEEGLLHSWNWEKKLAGKV